MKRMSFVSKEKGCGFDAASKTEIQAVSNLVPPERIIFAQTCKNAAHIELAREKEVAMMTFDSISELRKIKRIYPDAKGTLFGGNFRNTQV